MKINFLNSFSIVISMFILISCGGGGGGGGSTPTTPPVTPAPTVNLSAEPTSVVLDNTSTLTWTSSNATSCSATWTSQTGTSGSEAVTISSAGDNSFSITCTGTGGNGSAAVTVEGYRETDGVVVDGYISGAEVCIDEDDSWTCDSNENSTTSDNEGKFSIRYANGSLLSIGGTDLDSQTLLDKLLITHKLSGHSDFKAVTPVTSIAAFMEDASLVNSALGIDSSIDVSTFDPVANKGDGGIYDFLYEKGNQLTVLAYALQNITNDLNTTTETTQDYFKAITEEIEKEYTETDTKVDIETEAFVTKALDNVIAAKSATIDNTAKVNTSKALASVLPVIEVKSSNDLTTSVIRFAVSTLQTDIQAIANGTASAETITSYSNDILNYIAKDQNIDAGEIAPTIVAVADSVTTSEDTAVTINVLANDSYLSSSPVTLSVGSPNNGTTALAESAPQQITYTPVSDFNGTDSFSYTITQGAKTSSASVSVTVQATNDNPSINTASTLSILEGETSIATISIADVDGDELTLTISGTDANSFSLSSDNVLSLKQAANYNEKNTYSIILNLTDGINTVSKTITVLVTKKGEYVFNGKTIDGYIQGATVFLDQNYNFRFDTGELSSITKADGSFEISTNDLDLYNCVKSRPIVAEVPVGAIDSTLGEVTKAYRMVLPSISDTGNSAIVISPFTSLLGDAVVQAKSSSSIKDELTLAEGCSDVGNSIASSITSELNQIKNTLTSSLNISYDDLVIDFIADTSNSTITETSAQNIAKFFPYFKQLTDEFDSELSTIHSKTINTDVSIKKDSINAILADSAIAEIPVSFSAIYKTEPNDQGWFIQEKITAFGAKLNNTGEMNHYTCFGDSDNCTTSDISLVSLRDASQRYTRTSSFINNNYNPSTYNYQLVVEDEQRVDFDFDGNPSDRVCILQNWLYLVPVNQRENFTTNDRYNTGAASGRKIDKCVAELADKNEALFVALVDSYDDGTYFEEIDIRITNPDYSKSTFFSNKLNDLYNNRDNLNVDPLIQEIASIPRTFQAINILRDKLSTTSTDNLAIYWTKRNSASQISESSIIRIDHNPDNDNFEYATYENSDTGSIRTEVINSSGQQARDDLFSTINSKSKAFNNSEFNGLSAVTDQRTSLTGKTIDGYISGATVFFDVNFNQRLDAGEYSAITDASGAFEIKVNDNDLECIKARPIVANVPIGAEDSTLGTVNKAYQMLLPSVNDAGSNQVVISPFTSLLTEAILKGKAESDISEDLSVFEGCQEAGNNVASRISTEVSSMITLIENTYSISWTDLISDFIETGGTSKISESLAAKVAGFFPYYKNVKEDIAKELSDKFKKDVSPNVSLSRNSLSNILSTGEFTELPLEFFSVYKTDKNSAGWYQVEELSASNSFISSDGKLSREDCSASDTIGCDLTEITIDNVANASTSYSKQSNFFNNDVTINELKSGSLAVYANDSRSWRNNSANWQELNNRDRECQSQDSIQFQVTENNKLQNFHYSTYSQGYGQFDCSNYRKYYTPILNVATIFDQEVNDNSFQSNYYIFDILRSGVISDPPFDFVQNRLTIDPTDVIKEMAALPVFFKEIKEIRRKFNTDEYMRFEYHYSPKVANFEMGTFPRNDSYQGDYNEDHLYGQAARDAFFAKLKTEPTFNADVYGTSAPTNDSVVGRIANHMIEISDYKDSNEIKLPVYPSYNSTTKTLNLSLINSELNVSNIKDFLENGINNNLLNAKMYYNPDDSISGTMPIVLYLYQGNDTTVNSNEAYFSIEFSIDVNSENTSNKGAKQTFELKANQIIKAKFVDGDTTISRNISNGDSDKLILEDNLSDNLISQPATLQLKLLSLILKISNDISAIQNFFKDGETYTYKIDIGSGGYSIVDYDRNSVDFIEGSFKVASTPTYAINVNDIRLEEGKTEQLCFSRPSQGLLSATSFDLSFSLRERPGRGAYQDDFTLSSDSINFDENETEKCVDVTANNDVHFDWTQHAYLDISSPSNGQKLSRDRVRISIIDTRGESNRTGFLGLSR